MTDILKDLTDFFYEDGTDDVLAVYVNRLLASSLRAEYRNVETISAKKTLIDADTPVQVLIASGAAQDVELPAVSTDNHPFVAVNAGASNNLVYKNAGGTVIATVTPLSAQLILCSGSAWYTGGAAVTDATIVTSDITTNNASAAKHGFLAKLSGTITDFLRGDGTWGPAGGGGVMPNALINGGFNRFEHTVSLTPLAAQTMTDKGYNSPDMWYSLVQGAGATIEQAAGLSSSQYSAKMISGGTTNRFGIAQVIGADESISRRGIASLFQVKVKPVKNAGSGTMKIRIAVLEWTGTPNTGVSAADLVADWTSSTFTTAGFFSSTTKNLLGTVSTAVTHNTETQLSVAVTPGASCNNLVVFIWTEDVPAHAADYVLISEAYLHDGTTVAAWRPRQMEEEISLCQRRCIRFSGDGVAYGVFGLGGWPSTTQAYATVPFPVEMASVPSFAWAGQLIAWVQATGVAVTGLTNSYGTKKSALLVITVASGGVLGTYAMLGINNTNDAVLLFTADL